jgi:glycosyltransferase involved in cell wall biosynthesis
VYHGVDTNVWKPLDYIERKKIRAQLGWEDKYVIAYVARNVMRKAQDRLIKAIQILHDISNDYLLYLHCRAFDGYELGGWNLAWLAHTCGVSDAVQFSDTGTAVSNEQQISLVKKLACADLYVHTAKVEGFGLPIIEAMAVGLPVVVTADGGNIEEVAGNGIAAKIRPVDYDSWFNGAQLANVDPKDIAGVIQHIRGDKQLQKAASQNALRRAQQFSWSAMATTLADAVEQACG